MWIGASLVLFLTAFHTIFCADEDNETQLNFSDLTQYHDYLRNWRLNATKRAILDELNYIEPPNVTRWPTKGEMLRISELDSLANRMISDQPRSNRVAKSNCKAQLSTKYTFPVLNPAGLAQDYYRTYFNLANMSDYEVTNATLYFYIQRPPEHRQTEFKYRIHIYKYLANNSVGTDPVTEELRVLYGSGDWDHMSITSLVQQWSKTPHKNFGLMVKAQQELNADENPENPERDYIVRTPRPDGNGTSRMFLEIEVKEDIIRYDADEVQPNDCTLEPSEYKNKCCRFPLAVDFESFGWDWIIAPKRYNAYYCAGQCTFSYLSQYIHSRLMQQKLQLRNISGPCCNPQDMLGMKIVYIDSSGNIRDRIIPNMIVKRCGCA